MPVPSQVPGTDMGCKFGFRFDSFCEHRKKGWDAEHKGCLVMYLWQQLLGKLHLILKSD